MRTALTIAGSDSGGGAGIQADLKTFAAHGVYGASAITAVTAQNTVGVSTWTAMSIDLVVAQIEAVVADIGADAVKTGMLPSAGIVTAVAEAAKRFSLNRLVVDPVMIAKSGDRLIDTDAIEAFRSVLIPVTFLLTPNIPEAEALTGLRIQDAESRREAARRLVSLGASAVAIKGGHLPSSDIVDLLYDGTRFLEFTAERVASQNTHGTGCTFAAAMAAHLALGHELEDAIPEVQRYIAGAIRNAPMLGRGHGPMDHFWQT
ncbi:MAG: bifunctional hydroxymethylpyrimidine kinase/phosphomethylpyrimidine kinase [Acidobacteria bacterium]|nr:bifunctional hydroxymethylpyrimidine kinase/phosphomethylpyrimidine kinase [Acidobacteriota bacterium]